MTPAQITNRPRDRRLSALMRANIVQKEDAEFRNTKTRVYWVLFLAAALLLLAPESCQEPTPLMSVDFAGR